MVGLLTAEGGGIRLEAGLMACIRSREGIRLMFETMQMVLSQLQGQQQQD
jgi:hypothetical protein